MEACTRVAMLEAKIVELQKERDKMIEDYRKILLIAKKYDLVIYD